MTGRSTPGTWTNSRGVTMARLLAVVGSFRTGSGVLFCSASFCLAAARRFSTAARSARAICSASTAGSTASGSVALMCSILASWFWACWARSSRAARACSTVIPSGPCPPGAWHRRTSGPPSAFGNGLGPAAGAGSTGAGLGNNRRGPGARRGGDNQVGGGRRGCFRRQLQQPELAPGGRSPAGEVALFFGQFLDGAQRGAVPGADLRGAFGAGGAADRVHGARNPAAAGDFRFGRLAGVNIAGRPPGAGGSGSVGAGFSGAGSFEAGGTAPGPGVPASWLASRRSSLACRSSRRLRIGGCS